MHSLLGEFKPLILSQRVRTHIYEINQTLNKQQGEGEGGCQVVPCNYEINQIPGG